MKRTMGGVVVLSALVAISASNIAAQDDVADRRRPPRAPRVEAIMQMRDRLELTDEQLGALDEIRADGVQRRAAQAAELAEMRSRLAAGQIQRSELMALVEERREANANVAADDQARIDAVLTEAQRGTLQELREQARGSRRGGVGVGPRGLARGDRALRGRRPGAGRGGPAFGPGFAPGVRPGGPPMGRRGFAMRRGGWGFGPGPRSVR